MVARIDSYGAPQPPPLPASDDGVSVAASGKVTISPTPIDMPPETMLTTFAPSTVTYGRWLQDQLGRRESAPSELAEGPLGCRARIHDFVAARCARRGNDIIDDTAGRVSKFAANELKDSVVTKKGVETCTEVEELKACPPQPLPEEPDFGPKRPTMVSGARLREELVEDGTARVGTVYPPAPTLQPRGGVIEDRDGKPIASVSIPQPPAIATPAPGTTMQSRPGDVVRLPSQRTAPEPNASMLPQNQSVETKKATTPSTTGAKPTASPSANACAPELNYTPIGK